MPFTDDVSELRLYRIIQKLIKVEMAIAGINYTNLAINMARKHGVRMSSDVLRARIKRGNFSAIFLFQLMESMGTSLEAKSQEPVRFADTPPVT